MTRPSIVRLGLIALALVFVPARFAPARDDAHAPAAADAKAHAAAGHSDENPDILEVRPSLMVVTTIVFVTLLAVLWKFAWGPLSHALSERERKQEEMVQAAEEAKAESARLLLEHKRQMDAASEQVRQILEDARRQAEANGQSIVQKAQAEAEAEREKNKREIGQAKDQALSEIWSKTADLAVSVAGRVLSKELSGDDHRRLVDVAMGELPAVNGHGGNLA